jgi:hypothetical protein
VWRPVRLVAVAVRARWPVACQLWLPLPPRPACAVIFLLRFLARLAFGRRSDCWEA